jgi:hypothetical protein
MKKIELNIGDMVNFTIDGTKYELKLTKTSLEVSEIKQKPKRLLTIKEIVDAEAEAGKLGSFITDGYISENPLSVYGEHFRDTHTEAQAHKLIALAEIMRIADYYNEHYADGWKQDNDNPQQMKYMIFNKRDEFEPDSYHFNMFGLPTFATKELAQLALDNNREVFEKFFDV